MLKLRLCFPRLFKFFSTKKSDFVYWNKTERRSMMASENRFNPPVNRLMETLDRSFFQKSIPLYVAAFPQPKYLGQFVKLCKDDILLIPLVKHIVTVEDMKGVLLKADASDSKSYSDVLQESTLQCIENFGVKVMPYQLELNYDFWKADDILQAVLPERLLDDIPTGFAQAGHIAHLNLRDDYKKFGPLIGQVILDKNPKIETVVDKVDTIDNKFRTFKMNILAGKDDFLVEQSESGCRFRFDFLSVYWNSRLSSEHERIIKLFKPHEVVGDVFAGVGPFAIPAARKETIVLANDLNPESHKYLRENIALNRVDDFVIPFNLDGREFIRRSPEFLLEWVKLVGKIEKKKVVKRQKTDLNGETQGRLRNLQVSTIQIPKFISNYAMNLPDSAITFLDEFIGLYTRNEEVENIVTSDPDFKLPIINVHCFEKYSASEPEPDMEELHRRVHARIVEKIGFPAPIENFHFHLVRKVAPTKPMFCASFELPREVAFKKL